MNDLTAANALHAAETWLQRLGAEPASIVVVTIVPAPSVGVWAPGADVVATMPTDEAVAEVCEAAAPLVEEFLRSQTAIKLHSVVERLQRRATKLQLLLAPVQDEAELRIVVEGQPHMLAAVRLTPTMQ